MVGLLVVHAGTRTTTLLELSETSVDVLLSRSDNDGGHCAVITVAVATTLCCVAMSDHTTDMHSSVARSLNIAIACADFYLTTGTTSV